MCNRIVYLVSLVLILSSVSYAADIHWTGAGSDKLWTTRENWELNKVPTVADNVFLNMPAAKNGDPISRESLRKTYQVNCPTR